jgi:O-antigen/teichoic acid export membrane protein
MTKYLPAQVVPAVVGILSVPVITRLFSPGEYGVFSVAMATVVLATTLLGWVPAAIIRFHPAAEREGTLPGFLGTVQCVTGLSVLAGGALAAGVLLLLGPHLSPVLRQLLWIGVLAFGLDSLFYVYQHVLRARRSVGWYSVHATLKSAGSLGLGIAAVLLFGLGVEGLLWGTVATTALILPLAVRRALAGTPGVRWRIDARLTAAMARYGVPLVAGNIAAWVLSLSDRYILEFTRGAHEVGIYSVSYDIGSRSTMLIVTLFMLASGPLSMRIWERHGEERSRVFVADVTRYFLLLGIPAVAGLIALSGPLMRIMAGEEFFEGRRILGYVGGGVLLLGMQQGFQAGLLFHKRTAILTGSVVLSGLLNVVLNLLLVPRYGYMAAAVTTLVSYAALLLLVGTWSRRFFRWPFPFATLVRAAVAAAVMGAGIRGTEALVTVPPGVMLLLAVPLGASAYALVLLALGEVRPAERAVLRRLFGGGSAGGREEG